MKKRGLGILFLFSMIFGAAFAEARPMRLTLDYRDMEFRGNATLYLRQKIQEQYPQINMQMIDLEQVRLVAKSRMGQGHAVLQVGRFQTPMQYIAGNPRDFNNDRPATFSRVDFLNPTRGDRGVWQIQLQGDIKVRKVLLLVQDRGSQDQEVMISQIPVDRFGRTDYLGVYRNNVDTVVLEGMMAASVVHSLTLKYSNGMEERLPMLEGFLMAGQKKVANVMARNGAGLNEIIIHSSTNGGNSPAAIKISVGIDDGPRNGNGGRGGNGGRRGDGPQDPDDDFGGGRGWQI